MENNYAFRLTLDIEKSTLLETNTSWYNFIEHRFVEELLAFIGDVQTAQDYLFQAAASRLLCSESLQKAWE